MLAGHTLASLDSLALTPLHGWYSEGSVAERKGQGAVVMARALKGQIPAAVATPATSNRPPWTKIGRADAP